MKVDVKRKFAGVFTHGFISASLKENTFKAENVSLNLTEGRQKCKIQKYGI